MTIILKNNSTIPKSSVFFKGCMDNNTLGKEPFGRLNVDTISTQDSVRDSE